MTSALYGLFAWSVFAPIYTYAVYPLIIALFPANDYVTDDNYTPDVSILVRQNGNEVSLKTKLNNLQEQSYSKCKVNIMTITSENNAKQQMLSEAIITAKGDIIIITDVETIYKHDAVQNLVKHFADCRIGCVSGLIQNVDASGKILSGSAIWKYENYVRKLESRIGLVSGANNSILAIRKRDIPAIKFNMKNIPFFLATSITQSGSDSVFEPSAIAYELQNESVSFQRHRKEATGYWQALGLFWRMLLPRKGCFVYLSHRVMKWFVWLNLVVVFVTSGVLAINHTVMQVIFLLQMIMYLVLLMFGKNSFNGKFGKLIRLGYYFLSLNIAYAAGLKG